WLFCQTNQPLGQSKPRPPDSKRPGQPGAADSVGVADAAGVDDSDGAGDSAAESPRDVRPASPFAFGEPNAPSAPTESVTATTIAAIRLAGQERRIPAVSSRA